MRRALGFPFVCILLVTATALAGCHGLDETGDGPTSTPTTSQPPSTNTTTPTTTPPGTTTPTTTTAAPRLSLSFSVADAPSSGKTNDNVTFNVTVSGDSGSTNHAGAHYSFNSTATADTSTLKPTDFDGTTPHNMSFAFPGTYSVVNWTLPNATKVYVRPHMSVNGVHYWGPEFMVEIDNTTTGGSTPPPPAVQPCPTCTPTRVVEIGTLLTGQFANWAPESTTITVGQSVQWVNRDSGAPHTATSNATPRAWDTGNIAPGGGESGIFKFNTPGTYTYVCTLHPTTMRQATITVTA